MPSEGSRDRSFPASLLLSGTCQQPLVLPGFRSVSVSLCVFSFPYKDTTVSHLGTIPIQQDCSFITSTKHCVQIWSQFEDLSGHRVEGSLISLVRHLQHARSCEERRTSNENVLGTWVSQGRHGKQTDDDFPESSKHTLLAQNRKSVSLQLTGPRR